jgi:hypothetical protein
VKVKELIEKLQKLGPELEVMRHGYEGGAENVTSLNIEQVALDVNEEWYYGKHEIVYKDDKHPNREIINAVIVS